MKAAVFYEPFKPLKIEDVPMPELGPHDALIKVAACGICHTDLHFLEGTPTFKKPPIILGHEASGIVEDIGEKVENVKKGERVLIPPLISCGTCHYCRIGRDNLCENFIFVGSTIDGAYAEYIKVPAKDLIHIPEDIPLQEGAIIADALSSPFHGLTRVVNIKPGEVVAVFGCGGLGLNAIQIINAIGAQAIAIDISDEKLKLAEELGAICSINARAEDPVKTIRKKVGAIDVAVEAIGKPETIQQAFNSVKPGGRVLVLGYSPQDVTLSAGRLMFREIEIHGSIGCSTAEYRALINMVSRKKLKLLVSNKFKLDEINEAFKMLKEGRILTRAIVVPS